MVKREITQELVSDHWQIREIIKELRNEGVSPGRKHSYLKDLGHWIKWHTLGEEKTINHFCKKMRGKEPRVLAFEDTEEHSTIDTLYLKLGRTANPHLWAARLHLLCELIEHHLDEEEEEYFPFLREVLERDESESLAMEYRKLTEKLDPVRVERQPAFFRWLSPRREQSAPGPNLL